MLRSVEVVNKDLKNVSSKKCVLNKKFKYGMIKEEEYKVKLNEIISLEVELKSEKDVLLGGSVKKSYLDMNEEEISMLSLDELEKGLRSISSIKSRDYEMKRLEECDNKYEIFKKYKNENSVKNKGLVEVSRIKDVIDMIEGKNINKEEILKMLNNLIG